MATIQKIRSKGKLLITIIGIALLAFITEEFFRATEAQRNQDNGVVGIVDGDKFQSQEYSAKVEAFKSYLAFTQGKTEFTEDEDDALKEEVWQGYVRNKLMEAEAKKLGLAVTDEELRAILAEGTNGLLTQTPFVNQQTGRFDVAALKTFLDEYKKMQSGSAQIPEQYKEQYQKLYDYWQFVEQTLKESVLQQKYTTLLQASITSNPIEGKMVYDATSTASDLLLAAVPYSTIADKEISVSDADLKAKYEELKENFKTYAKAKDIKYVAVTVKASAADKAELEKRMGEYAAEAATTDDIAGLVRRSQSTVSYVDVPRTAAAYPNDISAQFDSMGVGSVKAPYYNPVDNTMNYIKMIAKTQLPDSVQLRQIQVVGKDINDIRKRADSIYTAIQGGAKFADIAAKYGQTGDSTWLVSNMYESSAIDGDNASYINKVMGMEAGQVANIEFPTGNVIVNVTARKNFVTKYTAAVIKCPLNFSSQTSKTEYNKFSKFIADNKTVEDMEKNAAKNGYFVQTLNGLETGDFFSMKYFGQQGAERHMLRWISNEAKKWIFDEAEDGEISQLFTCDNGAHLLVVAVTKSHKAGYLALDDVKEYVKNMVMRDKKAEKLMAKFKNFKSVDQFKSVAGAEIDTAKAVNFYSQMLDPAILSTVRGVKPNQYVGPIKGYSAVFAYQVIKTEKQPGATYDEARYIGGAASTHANMALSPRQYYEESPFLSYLKHKAKVEDFRYKIY